MAEQIIKTEYSELMQKSYIDYSMSVITARALPDARDGLKPVQRRVLYAMNELGLNYDKPHRKSARIVGDTLGKYHPHGDSSIYETLVVLSQDFKKGMALVDGHGNFGSIEGDGAAAMRYTEAKLKKFTQDVYLADLDKNVVDYVPNFDETEKEPEVLPVRVPNLLVNGADGIAVGMTTNIPTHNLGEVVDAVCAYMDNEDITTKELMQYCIGPDFPTGGLVVNKKKVQRIMKKLGLQVTSFTRKSRKYNSYKGKVGKTVKNRIRRRFYTSIPHQKITTDTTEFKYYEVDKKGHMTMNKLYLDPFMDMYNGEIISFRISKIASFKNMADALEEAIERTVDCPYRRTFHSDQGWAYQKKTYVQKLKKERIKEKLGWMSPVEYRLTHLAA